MNKIIFKFKNIYVITIVLILFFTCVYLQILNKNAIPLTKEYAIIQSKRIGIEVLRETGISAVNENLKDKNLFNIIYSNDNEIQSIDINTIVLNETMSIISRNVRKRFSDIAKEKKLPSDMYLDGINKKIKNGLVFFVPTTVVSNNIFFRNLGPKIPIKLEFFGSVGLDIKSRVKQYGINSALLEVYIYVEVNEKVILPFDAKNIKLSSEIPVVMKVIKGNIPNYMSNYNSSYSLPIN